MIIPEEALKRAHSKFTQPVERYRYSFSKGGSNEYADGKWTQEKDTIQASIRGEDSETAVERNGSGVEFDSPRALYVSTAVDVRIGGGDENRADEFEVPETGRRYKATDSYNDGVLIRVKIEEV